MIRLILIFSLITQTALANQCLEDIQVLAKGDVANCDGLLFSPKASKQSNEAIEDNEYNKQIIEKMKLRQDFSDKENEILTKRLTLYINQSESLADSLVKKENEDKWQKLIYFSLGIITTGIAVYGASKLDTR